MIRMGMNAQVLPRVSPEILAAEKWRQQPSEKFLSILHYLRNDVDTASEKDLRVCMRSGREESKSLSWSTRRESPVYRYLLGDTRINHLECTARKGRVRLLSLPDAGCDSTLIIMGEICATAKKINRSIHFPPHMSVSVVV